jgi:8-hydroxy-5-deazaflavin:NADPH oxidoreductase
MSEHCTIGVLGGTGQEGSGLAYRWARHGHHVIIGSRSAARAQEEAEALERLLDGPRRVRGAANEEAAAGADIVVLAVPYGAQRATAESVRSGLEGKILIDVTVPLVPPKVDRVSLPGGESAALALQRALGPGVTVVSAFQNVSAVHLKDPHHLVECDVLVCGDSRAARERVIALARDAGLRAYHAGMLANAAAAEALTSVLIAINKHYKVKASGIRITGVPETP